MRPRRHSFFIFDSCSLNARSLLSLRPILGVDRDLALGLAIRSRRDSDRHSVRLNGLIDIVWIQGDVVLSGDSAYGTAVDVIELRFKMRSKIASTSLR